MPEPLLIVVVATVLATLAVVAFGLVIEVRRIRRDEAARQAEAAE